VKVNLSEHINHPLFSEIGKIAGSKGWKAFVIGGFVRDALLGKESKDIDIVTSGSGIGLAQALASYDGKKRKITVYKQFGTAMLKYHGMELEFVGARKESYKHDSRNPVVSAGTIEDDQRRRDFTINTMSISLEEDDYGRLIDPFNGLEDLLHGIIRTPLDPDITFSDDPLRMMRAIRFSSQLGFELYPETKKAIHDNRERIHIVSQERITDELNKIVTSKKPSVGFLLMFETGLLDDVFPELARMQGIETINHIAHKDNFYHTLQVLDSVAKKSDNLWLRWAAILHDIAKPLTKKFDKQNGWTFYSHDELGVVMTAKIFKKFKLPLGNKMKYVSKLVKLHLRPVALTNDQVTDSGVRRLLFDAGDCLEDLMTLCEADITSKNEKKVARYLNNFRNLRKKLKKVEEQDKLRNWQPPICGAEIMNTFGIGPCREVGLIKNFIRESILDGMIGNNHDEAYQLMIKKGKELGLIK